MSKYAVGLVAVVLLAAGVACSSEKEIQTVKVGNTSNWAATAWPLYIAAEQGWFADEGIEVTQTFTRNQLEGLIGGDLNIINDGADDGLVAMERGLNILAVKGNENHPDEYLVAQPEITSLDQLVGGIFAVSGIPSTDAALAMEFLETKGINRDQVDFRNIGFSSARLAALEAKQVDAALLSTGKWLTARDLGFTTLGTPADFGEFPWNVVQVKSDWAEENKDALVGYLRSIVKAEAWLLDPANFEEAITILLPKTELDEDIQRLVLQALHDDEMYMLEALTTADFDRALSYLQAEDAIKPGFDIDAFLDLSYYNEATGG